MFGMEQEKFIALEFRLNELLNSQPRSKTPLPRNKAFTPTRQHQVVEVDESLENPPTSNPTTPTRSRG